MFVTLKHAHSPAVTILAFWFGGCLLPFSWMKLLGPHDSLRGSSIQAEHWCVDQATNCFLDNLVGAEQMGSLAAGNLYILTMLTVCSCPKTEKKMERHLSTYMLNLYGQMRTAGEVNDARLFFWPHTEMESWVSCKASSSIFIDIFQSFFKPLTFHFLQMHTCFGQQCFLFFLFFKSPIRNSCGWRHGVCCIYLNVKCR